jgi:3-phosphoglycerate kinase
MFKTLKDFSVAGKRILVRCDFNVPIDESGNILDDFRIRQALPTLQYLVDSKAKIILMSHLGEPEGKVVPELKLDKVAEKLAEYLKFPIGKEDDCIGPDVENESNKLPAGSVLLLENLRFHKEETDNDADFAKKLSYIGDIYVNDAFGVCHRDQASVTGVPKFLPYCAGFLLEKEIESLDKIMKYPEKPMVAIIGGTKVETKAKFIDNISKIADYVIVSGLIAKEVAEGPKGYPIKFQYPEKIIIPAGQLDALDINDESIKIFQEKIMQAKTILWNGPFGKFEDEKYAKGTLAIAKAIIDSGAYSVVGGGETVEFLNKHGIIDKFSHVSTGGGAMLSYLAGDKLPGLEALE